jgi:hypothetical protein
MHSAILDFISSCILIIINLSYWCAFQHYQVSVRSNMDPVSALGIAAAVVQFVQYGGSLVSKARQINAQGALVDYVDCENATRRLTELTNSIKVSLRLFETHCLSSSQSSDATALEVICQNCLNSSGELLARLDSLHLDGNSKHRRWKSFRQALKVVSSKQGVDSLARRIMDYRDELNSHILVWIRYVPCDFYVFYFPTGYWS